jgi:Tol biopolymer transport system component
MLRSLQVYAARCARPRVLVGVVVALAAACDALEPIPTPLIVPQDRDAAWSPDGQWLAFYHTGDSLPGLYVARIDGRDRRLLLPGPMVPGDWSPDGSAVVFTMGFAYQIARVDIATDSVHQLTRDGFNVDPAWSPDGREIAFDSDGGTGGTTGLWLMDSGGQNLRRVPVGTPERPGPGATDWSPSSDRLVGERAWPTSPTSFRWTLFWTDTLGRDTSWMTPPTSNATEPAWSPTGEWIAYVKSLPGQPGDIWLVHQDGSGDHRLVSDAFDPTWSPDGSRVAFSRRDAAEVAIWSVDLQGQNLLRMSWPLGTSPGEVVP